MNGKHIACTDLLSSVLIAARLDGVKFKFHQW